MEALLSSAQKFGFGKLAVLGLIGAGLVAALAAIVINLSTPPMQLLFGDLDPKTAASMTSALDAAGTKYKISADGSTIQVPRDKVGKSRMLLAGKGLLDSGSVGYELFDTQSVLGQTEMQQNINRVRAVDGELERTISAMDGVTYANVLVNLPQHDPFDDQAAKPSASVTVGMGARVVPAEMVQAVQNLVAGVIPGMAPEMVSVIDRKGALLSAANDGTLTATLADSRTSKVEDAYRDKITKLVEGIVGPGNARVEVTADLNLATVNETANVYNPDAQVVQSEQSVAENSKDASGAATTPVTAASNTPAGPGTNGSDGSATNTSGSTQSTTNYLNSNTVTNTITPAGMIKKLSVSVVLNNISGPVGKDGKAGPSTPVPAAEIAQITTAVAAAMGKDDSRGDVLSVQPIAFQTDPSIAVGSKGKGPGFLTGFDKNDVMRIVELVVLAIVSVLILLLGIVPLLKSLIGGGAAGAPMPMLGGGHGQAAGGASGSMQIPGAGGGENLALAGPDDARIDIARIEGQVKASSVKQVAEFVDKHPEQSVSILRSWLHETA